MDGVLAVGSRKSLLALTQTKIIIEKLKLKNPEIDFKIYKITTDGDITSKKFNSKKNNRKKNQLINILEYPIENILLNNRKTSFTKKIERNLLSSEIDIAIHSLKDVSVDMDPKLVLGSIPERGDPRDAIISRDNLGLKDLPKNSIIGTGSLRRGIQLLSIRSDLEIVDIRGNIDTRIKKIYNKEVDAVILAVAGLVRLEKTEYITEILSINKMLPAVGQGALAIQIRKKDKNVEKIVKLIDDSKTRAEVEAERACARRLGSDCDMPTGVYGKIQDNILTLSGMILSEKKLIIRKSIYGDKNHPEQIGKELADKMLDQI